MHPQVGLLHEPCEPFRYFGCYYVDGSLTHLGIWFIGISWFNDGNGLIMGNILYVMTVNVRAILSWLPEPLAILTGTGLGSAKVLEEYSRAIFNWSWSCGVRKIHGNPGLMTLIKKLQRIGFLQCLFIGPRCYVYIYIIHILYYIYIIFNDYYSIKPDWSVGRIRSSNPSPK